MSDIHGTTRDVIEDTINLQGITFRFIDTAGIRDTQDKIESMGIERTFRKLEQASIVLWVIDVTQEIGKIKRLSERILPLCEKKKLILVFNKIDNISGSVEEEKERFALTLPGVEYIFISAKENKRWYGAPLRYRIRIKFFLYPVPNDYLHLCRVRIRPVRWAPPCSAWPMSLANARM